MADTRSVPRTRGDEPTTSARSSPQRPWDMSRGSRPLFGAEAGDDDQASGIIYVLKSRSDQRSRSASV